MPRHRGWFRVILSVVVSTTPLFQGRACVAQEAAEGTPPERNERVLFQPLSAQAPMTHGGLFVGVNDFSDDPDLRPLRFAVHDAIELAYVFVVELKLIPAQRCVLAIAGKPTHTQIQHHLDQLIQQGVRLVPATKSSVLRECVALSRIARKPSDLLVVSFSSHGFSDKQVAYFMPSDGLRDQLEECAIKLNSIEEQMKRSAAGHRLLLVDACQERLGADTRALGAHQSPASREFLDELSKPTGQAKFASCAADQYSYEHPNLGGVGHGVFSFAFVEALRGGATPGNDKLVRLDRVVSYVENWVKAWVEEQNQSLRPGDPRKVQSPAFYGETEAFRLPFAKQANDLVALREAVKRRPTTRAFTVSLRSRLVDALEKIDVGKETDRELANSTRSFLDDQLSETVFVPFLLLTFEGLPQAAPEPLRSPFTPAEAEAAQQAWSHHLRVPEEVRNSMGMEFKLIPPGGFTMGSSEESPVHSERPHSVRITRPFYAARHEVTVGQFTKFVDATGYQTTRERGTQAEGRGWFANTAEFGFGIGFTWKNPGWPQESTHPVVNVSWNDAQAFVAWMSDQDGKKYRLFTEAEWEYCCRSGTESLYYTGDEPDELVEVGNVLDTTGFGQFQGDQNFVVAAQADAVSSDDHVAFTSPVGHFRPNGFGLFDLHGNVCEWCQDRFAEDYGDSGERDPQGASTGETRCARGGRFDTGKRLAKSFARNSGFPTMSDMILGFRIVQEIPKGQ